MLNQFFPEVLDFYESGKITACEPVEVIRDELAVLGLLDTLHDRVGVSLNIYSVDSEFQALMVLIFDRGLDASVYMEAGNVIAGRIADRLASTESFPNGVMISVPRLVDEPGIRLLVRSQRNLFSRSYLHIHSGNAIEIQTLLLPIKQKEQMDV